MVCESAHNACLVNLPPSGDEESVGRAIKESGVPRDNLFITTKLAYVQIRHCACRPF